LVSAARQVFASLGPDAPLEEIARAAGVSRTTLHRHFTDREALATAVLQENVADIEARAAALADRDDGAVELFHYMFDVQLRAPWLARVSARHDRTDLGELARRTTAAIEPLVDRARACGVVHASVTTDDVLLSLPMAMAAHAADALAARPHRPHRIREILHRGLFTTAPSDRKTPPPPGE
ncbi:TetR/AcrR family transcriptional regulator, partial [Phytoactinopolyspora endophytica]|uniref:TetR/AcrR family transcriptional regulator n=1 Tax=Phytoactinopolyspora endophytica TaxID=1642495 RepID=UPI0013EAB31A